MDVKVIVGDKLNAEEIARFQVDMALESENLALDYDRVKRGVTAVLDDANKGRYIVAKINNRMVGCLMLTQEWSDWNCGWYWWIQSVYVVPELRAQGIYKTMYNNVLELAQTENVAQIRLYVDKTNFTAQQVYHRLGMNECHYYMYEAVL